MGREGELRDQILSRAASDEAFRELLKSDPQSAVKEVTGVDIPSGTKIVVVEDTADEIHLVLPPQGAGSKMSDQELEQVAGGFAGPASGTACYDSNTCSVPDITSLW
jgi:hypothetical protein